MTTEQGTNFSLLFLLVWPYLASIKMAGNGIGQLSIHGSAGINIVFNYNFIKQMNFLITKPNSNKNNNVLPIPLAACLPLLQYFLSLRHNFVVTY